MKLEKSDTVSFRFNNGMDGLFNAMSMAEQSCLDRGVKEDRIFLVNLCLEELITNALRYGACGKDIINFDVSIDFTPEGLNITIIDDATPFNPLTEAPAPDLDTDICARKLGGLGIHLLKSMTSSIRYRYCNGQNIICIQI